MSFDYTLDYKKIDMREDPYLYKVGKGEQGVLLVEPYKSEILPFWKFKTPAEAEKSSTTILHLFYFYKSDGDFVGMDMARKFLQMGFTRARRYANHKSGKKYSGEEILPVDVDLEKAKSAEIFFKAWKKVEKDLVYQSLRENWKMWYG